MSVASCPVDSPIVSDGCRSKRQTVIKFTKIPYENNAEARDSRYVKLRRVTTIEDETITTRSYKKFDNSSSRPLVPLVPLRSCKKMCDIYSEMMMGFSSNDKYGNKPSPKTESPDKRKCENIISASPTTALKSNPKRDSNHNTSALSTIVKSDNKVTSVSEEKTKITAKLNITSRVLQKSKLTTENKKVIGTNRTDVSKSSQLNEEQSTQNEIQKRETLKPLQKSILLKNKHESQVKNINQADKEKHNVKSNLRVSNKCISEEPLKEEKKPRSFKNVRSKVDTMIRKKIPLEKSSNITVDNNFVRKEKTVQRKEELQEVHVHINSLSSQTAFKPEMKNQMTETSPTHHLTRECSTREIDIQTEAFTELQVPQLSLLHSAKKENRLETKEVPHLQLPTFKISPNRKKNNDTNNNTSIIIGEATVTYTQKNKINFVVGANDADLSSLSPVSAGCVKAYPFTVMSMLTREMENKSRYEKRKRDYDVYIKDLYGWPDNLFRQNEDVSKNKLTKPSTLIKINNNEIVSKTDYLSEQFQRELNFIDSFIDSLHYLENSCVVSHNNLLECVSNESSLDFHIHEEKTLSKIISQENNNTQVSGTNSLCLINMLIKEERRRAKNLILVLKMREDALKDFTKSQIMYLEKKKRYEYEGVSTLKKKQRGILLKLQQECREMQKMKKALLTLSESRQIALVQTKRNIEVKMASGTDNIIKKNDNENLSHHNTPIIVSSSIYDSHNTRACADVSIIDKKLTTTQQDQVEKLEKSIQTLTPEFDVSSPVVKVDGAYLNILFHNLAMHQMFSEEREYEVNESAIQNILESADRLQESSSNKVVELIGHQQEMSQSISSTPSTARSLVDEFDEYFSYMGRETPEECSCNIEQKSNMPIEKSPDPAISDKIIEELHTENRVIYNQSEWLIDQTLEKNESKKNLDPFNRTNESSDEKSSIDDRSSDEICSMCDVPVRRRDVLASSDNSVNIPTAPLIKKDSSTSCPDLSHPSTSRSAVYPPLTEQDEQVPLTEQDEQVPLTEQDEQVPLTEEEELFKKQIEIELEIMAIKQQMIPDKPPPPYTPPTPPTAEAGTSTQSINPCVEFASTKDRVTRTVHTYLDTPQPATLHPSDSLEELVLDFCTEALQKSEVTPPPVQAPWQPRNVQYSAPTTTNEDAKAVLTTEACQMVGAVPQAPMSYCSQYMPAQTDSVNQVLFNEWRKVESQWTSLESNEANVQNQVYKSIFDRVMQESIKEYNLIVVQTYQEYQNTMNSPPM